MPPSIILEVIKILTAEIDLREETRELEQAKPQLVNEKFTDSAKALSQNQGEIVTRIEAVVTEIRAQPDSGQFSNQIRQLTEAATAMTDAEAILGSPDTGSEAIGAETEAIELLLAARRSSSKSSTGDNEGPTGERTGEDLDESALALVGISEERESSPVDRAVKQATGKSGREIPEEFRNGLGRYFDALEKDAK